MVGGIGLGLGYVTPVATVAKWFPDKKGLATGMVIMGFGFGALVMSKVIAPWLMDYTNKDFVKIFAMMGVGFARSERGGGILPPQSAGNGRRPETRRHRRAIRPGPTFGRSCGCGSFCSG